MQLEYGEQRIAVAAEDLFIGSDPGATLRLAGAGVLPRHAVVKRLTDGHLVIRAADPAAEVRVNGTSIARDPTSLLHGDRITIGSHELRIVDPRRAGETRVVAAGAGPGVAAGAPPSPPVSSAGTGSGGRLVCLTDGREYHVDVAPFVLGRDAGSAVVLTSPDASRRHAEVVSRPDGDVLVDLSSNGSYVNGERVEGRRPLKALDVIRIGAEEFRYYPPPKREPAPAPAGAEFRLGDTLIGIPTPRPVPAAIRQAPAAPSLLASLLVKRGERKGDRIAVQVPVVNLGRADYNDVQLGDPSISASHAKLQLREGVWIVADLGSTNGTFVDDVRVADEGALSPGAILRLGEVELVFEPRDEGVRRAPGTTVLPKATPPVAQPAAGERPGAAGAPEARPAESAPAARSAPPASRPAPPPPRRRTTWLFVGAVLVLVALTAALVLL
jgi:pSer/pThr/pTyr-binding forkhead associated (FHA) protein